MRGSNGLDVAQDGSKIVELYKKASSGGDIRTMMNYCTYPNCVQH